MENQLNETDRADLAKRLQLYGLNEDSLIAQSLVTTASSITRLRADGVGSPFQPIRLRTNDFNDLNRWIGVPDRIFDDIEPFAEAPKASKLRQLALRETPANLARTSLKAMRAEVQHAPETHDDSELAQRVARAYLFGDARRLQSQARWLAARFPTVDVAVWPFLEITVRSGSVLEFGPGPHVLVAHSLTIESGGKVRVHGHLKVDVTTMQKLNPRHFVELNPALERLASMEVPRG